MYIYMYIYSNKDEDRKVDISMHVRGCVCLYVHRRYRHTPPRRIEGEADRARVCAAFRATAGTAHTDDNVVTDAVFHALMFALKSTAPENACEPTTGSPRAM